MHHALHLSILLQVRDLDKVEMLIKSPDVDVNSHRGRQGYTPLHWAAEVSYDDQMKCVRKFIWLYLFFRSEAPL